MGKRTRFMSLFLLLCLVSIGASALPDLVVSEIDIEPSQPEAGQSVSIEAIVSNHGSSPAEGPFFVHFFVDGRQINSRPIIGDIAPGGSKNVLVEWRAVAGAHTVSVEADPPRGRIEESDEENNAETRILNVFLSAAAEAAIGSLKVVVAGFDDSTNSGFLHVGEGVADKLNERLVQTGVHVLERSELEAIMQERTLNPSLTTDVAMAGKLLGADLLIAGSVSDLEVVTSTLHLGFLSFSGAAVDISATARLINVYTSEIMRVVSAEGHDEGATDFSVNLTGLLPLRETDSPDICGGGLQTVRSWYNAGESIPIAYRNLSSPEWFSIEITTGVGSFVEWLGWRYIDTNDCGSWYWNQLDVAGLQMSPGVYSAKLWDGTAYVAEVGFQIRPGISITVPPVAEITVGTAQFEDTIVGSALNYAVDDLASGLLGALEAVSPILAEHRASTQFTEPLAYTKEGQIAAILPDGRIAINIGASSGIAYGEFFEVLEVLNVVVDPQSLEILDYDILGVKGEIVVTEVRDRVSFGVLTSDFEPVIGDIVRWLAP